MGNMVIPQDRGASLSDQEAYLGGMEHQKGISSSDLPGSSRGEASANQLLESLGYAPELARNRSTMQVAFMSFVLAAIPYGLSTTMYYPLAGGGPANIIWGWLLVSLIILCVAASLGEITSVYPTAGGVYYQTFQLAPPSWRRAASWVCGWLYVVGNVTITLAVNFGTALFLVACINVFESSPGVGVFAGETWQIFVVFLAITLLCNAISAFGDRWLPILDVRHSSCRTLQSSRGRAGQQVPDLPLPPCRTLTSPPLAGPLSPLAGLVCFFCFETLMSDCHD